MKKVHYAWWVLTAAFFIYSVSCIGISTLPNIDAELKKQHGWTHAEVSGPSTLMYFLISIWAFFAGSLLDWVKPKLVVMVGGACSVLALLLYYHVQQLWHLYAVYAVYSVGVVATGILPGMFILSRWFDRYRGLAAGIFMTGSSLSGIVFPKLAAYWTLNHDWQTAVLGLAVISGVLVGASLLLLRNSPEELGLHALGDKWEGRPADAPKLSSDRRDHSFRLVLVSPVFYLLLFVTAAMWFCISSLMSRHLPLFLSDLQLDINARANIGALFFGSSIIGKIMFGFLGDKFDKTTIMLCAAICMALGSVSLRMSVLSPEIFLVATAIIYGIGYSGMFTMIQLVVAEYYLGRDYGKILGFITTADTLAGSLGIFLVGLLRTRLGSYEPAFDLMLALCIAAVGGILLLRYLRQSKPPVATLISH